MKYLSLFSGIEAASTAWKDLNWEAVAFSEIEPFPCDVLKHHHPFVPNLGDITKITESQIKKLGQIDLVVFGSPCQDLSISGKRQGLDGERSGLFKTAIKIIRWARKHNGCKFALWENVPGAFSSNNGRDFAEVIRLFTGDRFECQKWENAGVVLSKECQLEWRTLDAKHFGVPQRRRRIFALADFRTERGQPILFESKSVCGDIEESREKSEESTSFAEKSIVRSSDIGIGKAVSRNSISETAMTLTAAYGMGGADLDTKQIVLASGGETTGAILANCGTKQWLGNQEAFSGQFHVIEKSQQAAVAIAGNIIGRKVENGGNGTGADDTGECYTLTSTDRHAVAYRNKVRRLTPIECERLQGFPDHYTNIPNASDSKRYKALGNSMAVPVMKWIGERIEGGK